MNISYSFKEAIREIPYLTVSEWIAANKDIIRKSLKKQKRSRLLKYIK